MQAAFRLSAAETTQPVSAARPTLGDELMENDTRDILLYGRIADLRRRKTEAELMGYGTKTYEALIEIYQIEIAEILEARSSRSDGLKTEAA
jgi:hypothetical protein